MNRGTVKWFSDKKGYGFITPDDGTTDMFVHISKLGKTLLTAGQRVSYDIEDRRGKLAAIDIEILS